ncbi:Segregation and condensation protein A [Streptomyces sp. enrichment culture]|uniref:segregation and condensation protein A n=1 Tax=Streptomyces sp. enrichment culture TaxID=1795815 RepID=UPI003F570129
MTSNDAAAPAPRRRPLGRGPATSADAAPPLTGEAAARDDSAEAAPAVTPEAPAARVPASENAAARPERTVEQAASADGAAPPGAVLTDSGGALADERRVVGGEAGRPEGVGSVPAASGGAPGGEEAAVAGKPAELGGAFGDAGGRPADVGGPYHEAGSPGAAAGGDFGDGRFKVRLANFEGPFDLLLQLIAKHKLDVTEVALSKVTDEFMAHIRALGPDWDLDETTEFLVVAATLLDLKAARLLPAAEVEDEADLALLEARDLLFARLLQYRAYKQIADIFSRRLDDEARRFPRTVGLEPHHAELLPDVVISIGPERFAELAVKAMQPKPKPQVYVDHIHAPLVSVQEQAGIVVARLKELGEASFRALVEDTDDTLTVVARFLALLELYREKAVALDQETALGELTVRWTGGEGDAMAAVTDEFDRPPEQPQEERTP